MKLTDFTGDIQKQILRKLNAGKKDSVAIPAANMEPIACDGSLAKEKGERSHSQSNIDLLFSCYRHRLADADGISLKAAIDGMVNAGILEDDSPKQIRHSPECDQFKTKEEEFTVIEVYQQGDEDEKREG